MKMPTFIRGQWVCRDAFFCGLYDVTLFTQTRHLFGAMLRKLAIFNVVNSFTWYTFLYSSITKMFRTPSKYFDIFKNITSVHWGTKGFHLQRVLCGADLDEKIDCLLFDKQKFNTSCFRSKPPFSHQHARIRNVFLPTLPKNRLGLRG